MMLRLHPALPFLQIQNKDNGNIVLLAPPRPWRRRRRFTAALLTAIKSNRSSPVNDKRIRGEEGVLICTTFAPRLLMAEALCSGGTHRHSFTSVSERGEL